MHEGKYDGEKPNLPSVSVFVVTDLAGGGREPLRSRVCGSDRSPGMPSGSWLPKAKDYCRKGNFLPFSVFLSPPSPNPNHFSTTVWLGWGWVYKAEQRTCEDTGRRWPSAIQTKEKGFKEIKPAVSLIWTSGPQNCGKIHFFCLTHSVCGTLVWQPWQTNTELKHIWILSKIRSNLPLIISQNHRGFIL